MSNRELILQRIAGYDKQIDDKETAAVIAETVLSNGDKGAITRWKNKIAELEEQLAKLDEVKPVVQPSFTQVTENTSQSRRRDAVNLMSRDILDQPELCPKIDVAVFCRRMGVVWNTHCKNSTELEPDFLRVLEQRLCQDYRHSYQVNTADDPITTWKGMEEYLLSKHKSNSTMFQELSQLEALTLGHDEYLRDFAARLKSCAGDVAVIMKAKFKEMVKRPMEVDDLFEILQSDALIKQMTGHHIYKRHFDNIVKDLDKVYKPEDVASRASLYADRQVKQAPISSASNVYVATSSNDQLLKEMKDTMSQMKSFVASQKPQNTESSSSSKPKRKFEKKPWKELVKDSKFIEKAKTQQCHRERDNGKCDREVCPFKHSKPTGRPSSMVLTQFDSDHFH